MLPHAVKPTKPTNPPINYTTKQKNNRTWLGNSSSNAASSACADARWPPPVSDMRISTFFFRLPPVPTCWLLLVV